MNTDPMQSLMDRLGEPEPPPGFDRVVMARIVRVAESHPGVLRPVAAPREREAPARAWLDTPAWLGSVVGLALFFYSWIAGHLAGDGLERILTSQAAATAMMGSMPTSLPAVAGLAVGAALFVAGLFARTGDNR
jgi:hypothetical protein